MAKKEEFIPADLVRRLYNEGKGETEVIMQLRSQGFTPSQIDKAMKAVPKPKHVAPVEAPRKEEYRGPLPKELVRPIARAEAPEQRQFSPLEGADVGATPENITIPEELRPIEVGMSKTAAQPSPKHEKAAPRPVEEHLPAPAAAQAAGAPRISLERSEERRVGKEC
jgi:hypothetical protein